MLRNHTAKLWSFWPAFTWESIHLEHWEIFPCKESV